MITPLNQNISQMVLLTWIYGPGNRTHFILGWYSLHSTHSFVFKVWNVMEWCWGIKRWLVAYSLKGAHTRSKKSVLRQSLVCQGKRVWPQHAPNFKELGFKVGLSSFFGLTRFQLFSETYGFNQKIEGPTLKPSSLKVGACRGWNWFTLAYQTPFQNRHIWTCVASSSIGHVRWIVLISIQTCIWSKGCLNQHFKLLHIHMAMWLI